MNAKKENIEVLEVEIITDEQLQVFPEETQETIIFLSENISSNQLMVLNPFVKKLMEVRQLKDIKYDDSTPEAKKKSIESFKEAKSTVAEFKKFVSATKTTLKQPIDKVGKEILVIEKFGLSEVVDVLSVMEKTFANYLKEEKKKKDIAAQNKLDKANEAINEVQKIADEGNKTIAINEVKTMIQYTFLDEIETEVAQATVTWGIEPLRSLEDKLNKITLNDYIEKHSLNIDLLEDDVLDFLINNFNTKLTAKIQVVKDKITLLESQESHKVRDIKEEVKAEMQNQPVKTDENTTTPPADAWGKVVSSEAFSDFVKDEDEGEVVSIETHGIDAAYKTLLASIINTNKFAWNLIEEMNQTGIDLNIPREEQSPKVLAIFDAGNLLKKIIDHISNK